MMIWSTVDNHPQRPVALHSQDLCHIRQDLWHPLCRFVSQASTG